MQSLPFRRHHLAYAIGMTLSLAALPAWAQVAEIGKVLAVKGVVTAATPNGNTRTLDDGARIYTGDVIDTRAQGRVQIRFADGGLVSLRPGTRFEVAEYQQKTDQQGGSVVLKLLKGGLRTIDGAIGKQVGDRYQLQTRVATIGIRGTEFALRDCSDGSCGSGVPSELYGRVIDGQIAVDNDAGQSLFNAGGYFQVNSAQSAPQALLQPPAGLLVGDSPDAGAAASSSGDAGSAAGGGEQLSSASGSTALNSLPSFSTSDRVGEGLAAAAQNPRMVAVAGVETAPYSVAFSKGDVCLSGANCMAVADDNGRMKLYSKEGEVLNAAAASPQAGGTIAGTSGVLDVTWGQWQGDIQSSSSADSYNGNLLWAYSDNPTSATQINNVFSGSGSFSYSLVGTALPLVSSSGNTWTVTGLSVGLSFSGGVATLQSYGASLSLSGPDNITLYNLTDTATVDAKGFSVDITGSSASGTADGTLHAGLLGDNAEGMLVELDVHHDMFGTEDRIEGVQVLEK